MKEILLFTCANSMFREPLAKYGYRVREFPATFGASEAGDLPPPGDTECAVVEVDTENPRASKSLVDALLSREIMVVSVAPRVTDDAKRFLVDSGIADLIAVDETALKAACLDAILRNDGPPTGSVLLLEDHPPFRRIMGSIARRFSFTAAAVGRADEFFDELARHTYSMAFINLGAQGFDLSAFIRNACGAGSFKSTPLVPYKDMSRGVFVHEFTTGLNRIAKVILTPEEAFNFLLQVLYRMAVFPLVGKMSESVGFDLLPSFGSDPLPRIYHSMGADIFTLENALGEDRGRSLGATVEALRMYALRAEGLRWLARERPGGPTCGPGV